MVRWLAATETIYQETPMDGVVVDGMQVSNLFVYDAEGNPLSDVQVYDDRGRPVRTTYDDGEEQYWFPEGTEPWSFVSRVDADGRSRWNVYPLQGAPTSAFVYDDDGDVGARERDQPDDTAVALREGAGARRPGGRRDRCRGPADHTPRRRRPPRLPDCPLCASSRASGTAQGSVRRYR